MAHSGVNVGGRGKLPPLDKPGNKFSFATRKKSFTHRRNADRRQQKYVN